MYSPRQLKASCSQWLFLVPLKGGRDYIIPQLAVYTTYVPLIVLAEPGGLYATYHLLGEPETTIEAVGSKVLIWDKLSKVLPMEQ